MKIAIIGYMGSGKSSIGELLAKELNLSFIDLDKEIEEETGYTITETIFNKGELHFRKLERKKLEGVLEGDNFVLSTGGGTPCYYDNIELINNNTLSIYLQNSVKNLYTRLEESTKERPLIAHLEGESLKEYIGKHLFERNVFYDRATLVIQGGEKSKEEIVSEISSLINE